MIALAFLLVLGQSAGSVQTSYGPPTAPSTRSISLAKVCQDRSHISEKISELLEVIREHPTSGAYNTLGALYAQQDLSACATAAFEAAIRLDGSNWEAHYNLGIARLNQGDRLRAAKEFRAAIQSKPDSASSHYALGTLLHDERKLADAEAEFKTALRINPQFPLAAMGLSQVEAERQQYGEAIATLQQALTPSLSADEAEAVRAALGVTYAQSGDLTKATEYLKQLVSDYPNSADAHLKLGRVYAEQGLDGYDSAIAEYRAALRADTNANDARLALARVLVSQQKFPEALSVAQEYLQHDVKGAEGYYLEGLAYKALQRWDSATLAMERAVRLAPGNYDYRFDLAVLYLRGGRTEDARREFEAAAKINPQEPNPHHQLALLYEKTGAKDLAQRERVRYAAALNKEQGRSEAGRLNVEANQLLDAGKAAEAALAYRKALRLVPGDAQVHYNLALALDRLGDQTGERQELQRALRLTPDLAVAHNQLGLLAMQVGQPTDAEREFKAALVSSPKYAEALSNLGVLYSQQGKDADAAELFHQATQSDGRYSRAYVNLALTLVKHGEFAEAQRQLQLAVQADPTNAGAFTTLGMVESKRGHGPEAIAAFQKAAELQPNSSDAHLNLGIALVDGYDRNGGLREFTLAARLNPQSAVAHSSLGRFYFETGQYEDARKELETASRLQSDLVSALYVLALTERQSNNDERSFEILQKVVSLQPENSDAQFLLGQSLEKLGKTTEAIEHWKQALRRDPDNSQALYNLARVLNKLHDPEARQFQDRFDDLQRRQQITDRVKQLGNFALEAANAQNWPQAVEQMQEAVRLCGQCSEAEHLHKNLGIFYCRTGKAEEGEKELRMALALDPSDGDVQKSLEALEKMHAASGK